MAKMKKANKDVLIMMAIGIGAYVWYTRGPVARLMGDCGCGTDANQYGMVPYGDPYGGWWARLKASVKAATSGKAGRNLKTRIDDAGKGWKDQAETEREWERVIHATDRQRARSAGWTRGVHGGRGGSGDQNDPGIGIWHGWNGWGF